MKRLIIKSKTNDGFLAKQYCILNDNKKDGYETALIIKRLILCDNYLEFNDYLMTGHVMLKRVRNTALFMKTFSIKLKTFNQINEWINR